MKQHFNNWHLATCLLLITTTPILEGCVENSHADIVEQGIQRRISMEENDCYILENNYVSIRRSKVCLDLACEVDASYCGGKYDGSSY